MLINRFRIDRLAGLTCLFSALLFHATGCSGPVVPPDVSPDMANVEQIRAKLAVASSSDGEDEEAAIEFNNEYATLSGTITLNGPAPSNPTLNVNKDLGVCKPGGAAVLDEVVTVGPNQGLANVLVFAEVADPSWCHETMIGNTDIVDFDQKNCLFLNRIFPVQTTQKVRILNSDTVGHNAAMKPSKNPEYNPNIAGGGEVIYPPEGVELRNEKTPFPVNCAAHPWMQSFMIFRDNGYFAVTGEDGTFELPNLPAGVPIKINVWHEATKGVPGSAVTVNDAEIQRSWGKRGSFTVNLAADSQTELQVAINSSVLSK